jgi:hypothetical protein
MYSCRRLAGVSQLQVKLFSGCDKATSVSTMWRSFDISRVCTCKRHPGFLQVPLLGVLGYTLVALTLLLASSHWTTARIVTRGNATALSWRLHSLEGEAAFWGATLLSSRPLPPNPPLLPANFSPSHSLIPRRFSPHILFPTQLHCTTLLSAASCLLRPRVCLARRRFQPPAFFLATTASTIVWHCGQV